MKNNKSFQTPSSKPNDVTYRLARLQQTLSEADMFLRSIDPVVFPEQHAELSGLLTRALAVGSHLTPPAKRPRASDEEKAAKAAAKEAARVAAAAEKARRKNEAKPEKPAKAAPEAPKAAQARPAPTGSGSSGPMSAIDRALAAAKARKAAMEAA